MFFQEQTTVLKCPDQPGHTPNAAPSFLSTYLRNVTRLDSPASPLHCHALHNQSRIPASPGLHSRVHSPSISNMAALRYVHAGGYWICLEKHIIHAFSVVCVLYTEVAVGSRRFMWKVDLCTTIKKSELSKIRFLIENIFPSKDTLNWSEVAVKIFRILQKILFKINAFEISIHQRNLKKINVSQFPQKYRFWTLIIIRNVSWAAY